MEIKSILDVITNSSTEVFVIRYSKGEKRKDLIKILTDLFESLDLNIDDYLYWSTETKENKDEDAADYGIKTKKGDLIIVNPEFGEYRTLPCLISRFIENFNSVDYSITAIQRRRG